MDKFNRRSSCLDFNELYDDELDADLLLYQLCQIQQQHTLNYNEGWLDGNDASRNDDLTDYLSGINFDQYNDSKFLCELRAEAQERTRPEPRIEMSKFGINDPLLDGLSSCETGSVQSKESDYKSPPEPADSGSFILEGTGTVLKIMKASELWLRHTRLDS